MFPDDPKRKDDKVKIPAFKPAIIDDEGTLIPLNIYNYANVIPKGAIVDGIAQIDHITSMKSSIGKTSIGLSLIQLKIRKQEPKKTSSSTFSGVPPVYQMTEADSENETNDEPVNKRVKADSKNEANDEPVSKRVKVDE